MERARSRTILGGATFVATAMAIALAGCDSGTPSIDEFAGVWKYTESAGSATCSADSQLRTFNFKGLHKTLGRGVTSDLVDLSNCDYKFDVKDKVATIQPSQLCDLGDGDSETVTAITLTLNGPTDMEETMMVVDNLASTGLGTCNVTETGRLQKISKD